MKLCSALDAGCLVLWLACKHAKSASSFADGASHGETKSPTSLRLQDMLLEGARTPRWDL